MNRKKQKKIRNGLTLDQEKNYMSKIVELQKPNTTFQEEFEKLKEESSDKINC